MNMRLMTTGDIPFAMALKAQNGWNQLEGDWRRQLDLQPDLCFVAEVDSTAVGTACVCVFDDVSWINMVLVDRAHRSRGIGTALLTHVLAQLDARRIPSIRLDATPLGQPLYEKLGFQGDFALARYEGVPLPNGASEGIEHLRPVDMDFVVALDEAITQTRRAKLLHHLFSSGQYARKYVRQGYAMCRPGSNAWQIGPVQGEPDAARVLLLDAFTHFAGQRVYVDVPSDNAAAVAAVESAGLRVQRPFLRMTRGRQVREDLQRSWCTFGPEKG
jgi:GNAT superfamily N-acetyltransferase